MPTTFSNKRLNVNDAWKPSVPKQTEMFIFGIEVDAATFKKYNHQDYTIGFGYYDLNSVERWATDPDRVTKYPKQAAEARLIMYKIVSEITGKDVNNVSHKKTAAEFITALENIYNESRATYDELHNKIKAAKDKMERAEKEMRDPACEDRRLAEAEYAVAKEQHKLLEYAFRGEYSDMMEDHAKRVAKKREEFVAYLADYYAATPDDLDAATMQLLESGICTAPELARLAERHEDNPTMLRIIGSYAGKLRENKNITRNDQIICSTVISKAMSAKDGSKELEVFDSATHAAAYGLNKDYYHATAMHKHVGGWFDAFRKNLYDPANEEE